ncbi:LIC13354 family exoprotein [Leptospira koniambonensis]|uniref:LIC13354 family exoprotein n=1 Tax=Leptospira koniambonensis TaxID=2484950 RepID=UPI003EBD95CB
MRKFKRLAALTFAVCSIFVFANCFDLGESSKSDNQNVLALVAVAGLNPLAGNYNYYNGTPDYPGGTFTAAGNVVVGTYNISLSLVAQTMFDETFGNSYLYGEIQEIDTNKKVVYVRFTSASSFSQGNYAWLRWMVKDGKTYVCPDLSDVSTQTTLASAKDDDLDFYSDTNDINAGCGLNSGFDPAPWSRLESQN